MKDVVVDPRNSVLLCELLPDSDDAHFNAGHLIMWESPDGFVHSVTSFLEDHA